MTTEAQRSGTHRRIDTTAKRRIAFAAVAVTGVAAAGATGAGAATVQKSGDSQKIALAADSQNLAQGAGVPDVQAAAQVLSVPQSQQISDLAGQLDSAVQFAQQRVTADLQSRAPETVKPTDGTYTSGFEVRWGTMHKGIDLAAPLGTPIVAAQKGTVIDAGPASGFGNWVRIKHDDGTITVYGHMQTIDVTVGQQVTAGQKIAGVGSEGFSTGPHCHFEVYPDGVNAIDPVGWLADRGINV